MMKNDFQTSFFILKIKQQLTVIITLELKLLNLNHCFYLSVISMDEAISVSVSKSI